MNQNNWTYIDKSGKSITKKRFSKILPFSEGYAGVMSHGKFGAIDKTGTVIISPQFDHLSPFNQGLARVSVKGIYGFVDKAGEIRIPSKFEDTTFFSEGFAAFQSNGKWGYINQQEEVVIPPKFDTATPFISGQAYATTGGTHGKVSTDGTFVVSGSPPTTLISYQFVSQPPNATVYIIPLLMWLKIEDFYTIHPSVLESYHRGVTPLQVDLFDQKYMAVFVINEKSRVTLVDVIQGTTEKRIEVAFK